MNLPKLKSLEEVRKEYLQHSDTVNYPIPENLNSLGPSELNRLYTMISDSDGTINQRYLRDLQAHINSLPPRPAFRVHYNNKQLKKKQQELQQQQQHNPPPTQIPSNIERNKLPRSRLIDQFYSHQLPGIQSPSLEKVRQLIEHQKQLRDSAKNCGELLDLTTRKLSESYPEISHSVLGVRIPSKIAFQEDEQNGTNSKIPKCPLRFMESSIAIVLEHTEHISIDLKRQEFDNQE